MWEDLRATPSPAVETDPQRAFQRLLDKLVVGMSVLGLPAVLIALSRAADFGWHWGLSVQTAAWGGIVGLLSLRHRLSFRQRIYGFLALMMLYGAAGVMTWGLSAQGFLLLFGCVVMATLVDGPRAGLLATFFALATGSLAGLCFVQGWLAMGVDTYGYNRSLLGWATALSTAAVVMLAAVWGLGGLKYSWLGIIQVLREREDEYASILRFTPDIIYRLDVHHRITYISDAVRRYGYEPDDLRGRSLLDFVHPDERATVARRLQERRTGPRRTHNMEVRLFQPVSPPSAAGQRDAMAQPVFLISAEGLYEAGKAKTPFHMGTQGVARDITEYKSMYRELLREKMFSEITINSLPGIIYLFSEDARLVRWNRNLEELTGCRAAELRHRHILDFFPDEEHEMVGERFREALSQGTSCVEAHLVSNSGTATPHLFSGSVLAMDGRRFVVGMGIDITYRRQAQREKKDLQQKLERARKMEALGLLAGGVAHDLNNILSGIVSYPSLMMMKLPPDSPLQRNLAKMKASGEKASEIVQDLLTLARRGVNVKEALNINQVIREHLKSAEYLHLRARHHGVRVVTELAPDLLPIEGSPLHLKKALMNLISNAFEAQPGGGSVTIQTCNRYIDRPLKGYEDIERGEFVRLRIVDQGEGMAPEEVERIFEPFYSRKIMGRSGTGLGMAVVWGTVQDHQGYIHVRSAPGRGTRFDLYFPITRRTAAQVPAAPDLAALKGGAQAVLVVDDDREQREVAVDILETLNYRGAAVADGAAALDYLAAHAVDLLVLDMVMPGGMDGLETLNAVRRRQPRQKVLLVSGFSETQRVREALRLGAVGFVRKPYTVERLAQALQEAFGGGSRN